MIDRSTYRPRYDSADVIEYTRATGPSRAGRYLDAARGRLGLRRVAAARWFAPLADVVRDRPASIVLAHNAPILPRLLRESAHTIVVYAHNDLFRAYSKGDAGRAVTDAAAVVCVSEALGERTRDRLPRSLADLVHVVGNGVDTGQFSPGPPRSPGRFRIVFMGRVIPDKGVDVLVRAAALLGRGDGAPTADTEVVVIGRPGFAPDAPLSDYEKELRRLAEASAIPVAFEGFTTRTELPARLRTADAFVVPSRWPDPAPLTVGEALATGLPVVASRIGGIPELVGDAGVLVTPDDPAALARALRSLLADADRRAALSAAARARALSRDWSWSWRQLEAVLAQV